MTGSVWAAALLLSTLWIIYRIYLVFQKPIGEIEEVLGLDIPPQPDVALSSITSTSVLLYWKSPENYAAQIKHSIQINGINIGEYEKADSSVQLTGLVPGNYYGIRAINTNTVGHSSYSRLIQVRTTPLGGHRGAKLLAELVQSHEERPHSGCRASTINVADLESARCIEFEKDGAENIESVPSLTRKLGLLREQKAQLERELANDMIESENSKAELTRERDDLKKIVDNKEKVSLESRKQLNELEKQFKVAQREKSRKERSLQIKKQERQKMRDEMARWENEKVKMSQDTESLLTELVTVEDRHLSKISEAQKCISEAHTLGTTLEEEIREWGIKVNALREDRDKVCDEQSEEDLEADRIEREDETSYRLKLQDVEVRYRSLAENNRELQIRFNNLMSESRHDPSRFAPISATEYGTQGVYGQGYRPARNSISRTVGPTYQPTTYAPPNSTYAMTNGPAFPSLLGYANLTDGQVASTHPLGLTLIPVDTITGGGQMSPSADILLPSNLLGDDDVSPPGSQSFNGTLTGSQPRQPDLTVDSFTPERIRDFNPQSPVSMHSPALSLLSSPLDGGSSLFPPPSSVDADHSSLRSASSPFADFADKTDLSTETAPRRRISNLFSFNRQPAKSGLSDSPALGTLKQGQSQSFPSEFDDEVSATSPRKNKAQSPWSNIPHLLSGGKATTSSDGNSSLPSNSRPIFGSRARSRRLFSKLEPSDPLDPLDHDRGPSPRPQSTYSFDNSLLRPGSDSQPFGVSAIAEHLRHRSSPLGTRDWSSMGGAWSASHSRRQSIQHGSTSNLSIGSEPLGPMADDSTTFGPVGQPTPPTPIGTERAQKSRIAAARAKLNPNAPNFTTRMFNRGGENKKTPKLEKKSLELGSEKSGMTGMDTDGEEGVSGTSPSMSRMSRDDGRHSVMTSTTDSHDSMGGDSAAAWSAHSELLGSSQIKEKERESFMQRLTRKSSNTKFTAPWAKGKEKNGLAAKKSGDPLTPSEVDEDGTDYLGRSVTGSEVGAPVLEQGKELDNTKGRDAKEGKEKEKNRISLSWARGKTKGKKKGEQALSETSEDKDDD